MKKFLILPIALLVISGCSSSNKPFTAEENRDILLPYFNGSSVSKQNLPFYTENLTMVSNIKSLSDDYPIEIVSAGGAKLEKSNAVNFYYDDYMAVMDYCNIKLSKEDVINKTTIFRKIFNREQDNWKISNKKLLEKIDNCANSYFKNTPIKRDELSYFLADDRIKNNLHYDFLKNSISNATKDKVITYIEIFDIYRNLDKALDETLSTDLNKFNSGLKDGEHNHGS